MSRTLFTIMLLLGLSGCGAQATTQVPVEVTRVVLQEVTREVVQAETRVVVVTATPEEAPPTATLPAAPTVTPLPEPTIVPEPTTVTALEPGAWVEGEIIRKIRIYDIPNEYEGREVTNADPGASVRVLYRGGQWYQIEGETNAGETVTGWVYKDWINIAPEDESRLQPNPEPLPVVVSEITTTIGDDWKQYWSGTVMNIGSKTAYDVQVEISLNGQVGDTETLADRGTAYVVSRNLEPGQAAKFTVQTSWVRDENVFYSYEVRWTER